MCMHAKPLLETSQTLGVPADVTCLLDHAQRLCCVIQTTLAALAVGSHTCQRHDDLQHWEVCEAILHCRCS